MVWANVNKTFSDPEFTTLARKLFRKNSTSMTDKIITNPEPSKKYIDVF